MLTRELGASCAQRAACVHTAYPFSLMGFCMITRILKIYEERPQMLLSTCKPGGWKGAPLTPLQNHRAKPPWPARLPWVGLKCSSLCPLPGLPLCPWAAPTRVFCMVQGGGGASLILMALPRVAKPQLPFTNSLPHPRPSHVLDVG